MPFSVPQYFEEREVSELQCTALKKDSKMYKDRIEAILQQMDEVCLERNMVCTFFVFKTINLFKS